MEEITITLGTTNEIVQKAIEYANICIVMSWIVFGLTLSMSILTIALFIEFIKIRAVAYSVTFGITTICLIFMMIFCPYNAFLWEQKIETFSQNPDEAVEYYIDNIMEVSHD